jgi:superfamily II DNA or RNA helicase
MPGYFEGQNPRLTLSSEANLRRAQRAAIWALAARVLAKEPVSQAILPTGVGKTAVIAVLPFVLSSKRVLIVVPSKIVRRQVSREFTSLRTLKRLRVLPADTPGPRLKMLRNIVRSAAEWESLKYYDVVVTTPQCISSAYAHVAPPPAGLFDLLVVDEAHHSAAPTWNKIIDDFANTPAVLLTATPFRRDKRRLPGEIAYAYPLREAIQDRVYSPIDLIPVQRVEGESQDVTLAKAARKRLALPRHVNLGSQVVVRTDRVDDAFRLKEVYHSIGLDFPVLTGDLTNSEADIIVDNLSAGTVKGVIVVGILTEGFDLPRLKIAVYHQKHKSFAATLQFVGRLARTTDDALMQPELLAIPDDLSSETAELYHEDASWTDLLPEIADAAVAEERTVRTYLQAFSSKPKDFSLISVEPRLRVQIFELNGTMPALTRRFQELMSSPIEYHFVDEEAALAAFVTRDIIHPDWLRSTSLDTISFGLHIICVDPGQQYLFIQTSSAATTDEIIKEYALGAIPKVAPSKINAALHTYGITDYSMVGLRNKSPSAATGFSYKTVAGFSASRGLTFADQSTTSAGHLSARFVNGGSTSTIGSSLDGAKFWESTRSSLYDFRAWCNVLANKLNEPPIHTAPPSLNVSIREALTRYPQSRVLATVMPSALLEATIGGATGTRSVADCRIVCRVTPQSAVIGIALDRKLLASCRLDVRGIASDGRYGSHLDRNGRSETLATWLNEFPPTLFFANGTSAVEGTIAPIPASLASIDANSLQKWDWADVDIQRESRPPRAAYRMNILQRALNMFVERDPNAIIIVDDNAYEIADIIVIHRQAGRSVLVELIHCKWSREDISGHRIGDLSEVITQVCRSVRWCFPELLSERLKHRLNLKPERLYQGSPNECAAVLDLIASKATHLSFVQYAIQPGVAIDGFLERDNLAALATICANWCTQFDATFVLCGS